jgi:hypothetical protein
MKKNKQTNKQTKNEKKPLRVLCNHYDNMLFRVQVSFNCEL